MKHYYKKMDSPVGNLTIIANETSLVAILWENGNPKGVRLSDVEKNAGHPILRRTERQLKEYFKGKRTRFDVPCEPQGTIFQKRVWRALSRIPFGETRTYLDIATELKNSKACRAVGAANGKNPISIIVPCHRVIGSDGSLTGFAGGIKTKQKLLDMEHTVSHDNCIR